MTINDSRSDVVGPDEVPVAPPAENTPPVDNSAADETRIQRETVFMQSAHQSKHARGRTAVAPASATSHSATDTEFQQRVGLPQCT